MPCLRKVFCCPAFTVPTFEYFGKSLGDLSRSHRICQALRPSYSEHTYGEKTVMPPTRTTFPLASGRCPEALPLNRWGGARQAGS